ncbi:transcriptional regulator [Methanothermococcus sp. SCGC AD-155-M21]|nr:transcriptional regulator [Methanothermococcus sp. SCGC AD-155-M21]
MREIIISECIAMLQRFNFIVSQTFGRSCFDILARRNNLNYLIKILKNIDSLSNEQSMELIKISKILNATPLLIGLRTRNLPMEEGVVYERHNIKSITLKTFELYLRGSPPIVYAGRGGFFVNIEGNRLRTVREKLNISIGELAEYSNVSRKMIYKYEQNMANPTIEVALKIEEYLDVPLIKDIPLELDIDFNEKAEREICSRSNNLNKCKGEEYIEEEGEEGDFKLYVMDLFNQLGFNITETKRAPFDAVVEKEGIESATVEEYGGEGLSNNSLLLTNIEERETEETKKKMLIVNQLSSILNSGSLLVLEKEDVDNINYVKTINIKRLEEMDDALELFYYITNK